MNFLDIILKTLVNKMGGVSESTIIKKMKYRYQQIVSSVLIPPKNGDQI